MWHTNPEGQRVISEVPPLKVLNLDSDAAGQAGEDVPGYA
jgi:hypothetical protein